MKLRSARHTASVCAGWLAILGGACDAASPADTRSSEVATAPPSGLASSPWLVPNEDGTYRIDECAERSAPRGQLGVAWESVAGRGIHVAKGVVAIDSFGLRATIPPWLVVRDGAPLVEKESPTPTFTEAGREMLDRILSPRALVLDSQRPHPALAGGATVRLFALRDSLEDWSVLRSEMERRALDIVCRWGNNRNWMGDGDWRPRVEEVEEPPWRRTSALIPYFDRSCGQTSVLRVDTFVRAVGDIVLLLGVAEADRLNSTERESLERFRSELGKP